MEPFYVDGHFAISAMSQNTLLFKIKANYDEQLEVETDNIVLPFAERKLQNHQFTFRFSMETDKIKFETLYSKPFNYCHWVSLINEANEENLLSDWYGLEYYYRNSLVINLDVLKQWIRSDTIWIKYIFLDGIQFKLDTKFAVTDDDRVIYAIKSQISKQSDVMKTKFDNEWKDMKGLIEIKDVEYDTMAKFIDSLHTGRIKNVNVCCQNKHRNLLTATCDCHYFKKEAADYLKLGKDPLLALKMKIVAKTYNVEFVEKDAKKVLIEKLNADNIRQVLSYAHKHHDDEIKELTVKYFIDNGVGTMDDVALLTGFSDQLNELKI